MAITNPGAITFCNEDMRPLAEWLRKLKAISGAMNDEWGAVHSANVPDSSGEYLNDGREAEGVTQVTGEDMHDLMNLCTTIETALNNTTNEILLAKFAVRPLRL
jgi:hypothetical protein